MRLWSVQTKSVYEEVMTKGYALSRPNEESLLYNLDGTINESFNAAYNWMINKMQERISKPDGVTHPWWAYYKVEGKEDLSLSDINYLDTPGDIMVALELEVPEEEVLLSDLGKWHFVVSNMWISDSTNEEEWNRDNEYFDSLSEKEAEQLKIDSWDKVFDMTQYRNDWIESGYDIQATFWILKKEYIISATEFVVQDIPDTEE